jgi:hypothetical protein
MKAICRAYFQIPVTAGDRDQRWICTDKDVRRCVRIDQDAFACYYYYYITPNDSLTADLTVLTLILLIVLLLRLSAPDPAQVDTLKSTVHHTLRVDILVTTVRSAVKGIIRCDVVVITRICNAMPVLSVDCSIISMLVSHIKSI